MSKYYYLISGLPNIALDDSKLAYSVCEFRTEIEDMLSSCLLYTSDAADE